MLRTLAGLTAVVVLCACGSAPTVSGDAASSARESPQATGVKASVYGVLVDLHAADPLTYQVSVVSLQGTVAASFKAARRSLPAGALEAALREHHRDLALLPGRRFERAPGQPA